MSARRITAPLLAMALGAATGLTTAPSATAETSRGPGDTCLLRAQAVKVTNVQDDASGTDAAVVVRRRSRAHPRRFRDGVLRGPHSHVRLRQRRR